MSINLNSVRLPKKINPCPITEAIVELRFDSSFPHDAIFGVLYNEFKNDYPEVKELPILQLPEIIRKQDPALKYKPYYRLSSNEGFIFQVGARTISLISLKPYSGWEIFSDKIKDSIKRASNLGVYESYVRVGIRYINGFDQNVLEKINLSLKMNNSALTEYETSVRMDVPTGQFTSTLRVANNAQITKSEGKTKGSVIDIDTYLENPDGDIIKTIEDGHLQEKKLFFALLKQDYLENELNPEY